MTDQPAEVQPEEANPDDGSFLRARFAGGRFDTHTIPFDVLPDLAAYRSLIIEVAKMLFKRRHNNRERVPKGFEDSFQIGLAGITEGSAVAVARRLPVEPTSGQVDLGFSAYQEFDDARDYVDQIIDTVRRTGTVPADFPTELAGRFNPFGQSLRQDEYVDLSHGRSAPVRYDTFIRKTIVLSREPTYENAVNEAFMLNGGMHDTGTIHVRDSVNALFDFRPLTSTEFEKAMSRAPQWVQLVGTGLYDRTERLRRLIDVRVIYDDDQPRQKYDSRLDEIAQAAAGWYDSDNPAPTPHSVEAMRRFVSLIVNEGGVPAPYLYPTPEGGVAAEWTRGEWEISVTIADAAHIVEWHAINTTTLEEINEETPAEDVSMLGRFMPFWEHVGAGQGNEYAS